MMSNFERLLSAIEADVRTLREYAGSAPVMLLGDVLDNLVALYQDELLRAPLDRVPTVQAAARQAQALRAALKPDGDQQPRI